MKERSEVCDVDLEQVIEQYHGAADEFARGNPDRVKIVHRRADPISTPDPEGPLRAT